MRFRPSAVPTVIVLAALVVLANLGTWQLRRHAQTAARLAEINAVHDGGPVRAQDLTGDPEALKWRRAELTGAFQGAPAYVTGRTEHGTPGFDVVAPYAVDEGPVILVNRGWIPMDGWAAVTLPTGRQPVHGLVLPLDGPPETAPIPPVDDLPERWPPGSRADLGCGPSASYSPYRAIAARSGLVTYAAIVVAGDSLAEGTAKPRADVITGYYVRPVVRPHLEYAATWFSIGAVLLLLWIYAAFRRADLTPGGRSTPGP